MNDIYVPNDAAGVFQTIHMPEFGLTWAGGNPFEEGFCFGSETGQVVFADAVGKPVSAIKDASVSREAVNGVAFSQNWLAVTTRKDINFIGPCLPRTQPPDVVTFFGGGRDVAVAPTSGHFVIPLGPDGIMFVKPGTSEKDPVTISRSEKSDLNFCRVLALPGEGGNDVVVCAGRRGGLGYADYREGIRGHMLHTVTFNNLDLVDVCSVATLDRPLAVVAAAKDGALVFFNDILTDKNPKTIKFKGIKGTVYRVLSAQGDIYLLTSKGLFGLFRLGASFLQDGTSQHVTTDILRMQIAAADANMVSNKWLLAAGTDDLFRFDLEKMPKSPEGATSGQEEPEQVSAQPQWEESRFEQKSECMVGAV